MIYLHLVFTNNLILYNPKSTSSHRHLKMRRSSRVNVNAEKAAKEKESTERVLSKHETGLKIIDAGVKGRGVAATKAFMVGDYVAKYQGELVTRKVALDR